MNFMESPYYLQELQDLEVLQRRVEEYYHVMKMVDINVHTEPCRRMNVKTRTFETKCSHSNNSEFDNLDGNARQTQIWIFQTNDGSDLSPYFDDRAYTISINSK